MTLPGFYFLSAILHTVYGLSIVDVVFVVFVRLGRFVLVINCKLKSYSYLTQYRYEYIAILTRQEADVQHHRSPTHPRAHTHIWSRNMWQPGLPQIMLANEPSNFA